jgi:ribonuclease PH
MGPEKGLVDTSRYTVQLPLNQQRTTKMHISELIKQLQDIQLNHGDLAVFNAVDDIEGHLDSISIGFAEHHLDEETFENTKTEDNHQVAVIYSHKRKN